MPRKTPLRHAVPAVASFALAICSIPGADGKLVPSNRVQLMPAGQFRGINGLPADAPYWYIDGAIAQGLITAINSRQTALVIDYDHQTLFAAKTGVKAIAAAWWKGLEWEEGVGLFAIGVDWTAMAAAHITADEFRYISPVFLYDRVTGAIMSIVNAALTNTPNIDGMADVTDLVAASLAAGSLAVQSTQETYMDDLLEQLRWMLNLPVGATVEDVLAQLQKLTDQLKAGPAQAAASFSLVEYLAGEQARVAAASQVAVDPAKYVPIASLSAVQHELNTLRLAVNSEKVDGLVKGALADGRLLPAQEAWARDLGGQNFAALSQFVVTATANPALAGGTQTGGAAPAGSGTGALSAAQLAVCTQMGIAPEDFQQTLATERAAA
ncbi:MAG: phage protease [Proteobacteria bacterium]|nr:phage protease [Pseudomonadota bacterium]